MSTFHQEMLNYHLSPSYEYQDKPYDTWYRSEKKKTFKAVARTIFLWTSLYLKMAKKRKMCTVCYSSETGTGKKLAKQAVELFSMSYKTQLLALDTKSTEISGHSDIELVIASTFGNGESPESWWICTSRMSRRLSSRTNTTESLVSAPLPTQSLPPMGVT